MNIYGKIIQRKIRMYIEQIEHLVTIPRTLPTKMFSVLHDYFYFRLSSCADRHQLARIKQVTFKTFRPVSAALKHFHIRFLRKRIRNLLRQLLNYKRSLKIIRKRFVT